MIYIEVITQTLTVIDIVYVHVHTNKYPYKFFNV